MNYPNLRKLEVDSDATRLQNLPLKLKGIGSIHYLPQAEGGALVFLVVDSVYDTDYGQAFLSFLTTNLSPNDKIINAPNRASVAQFVTQNARFPRKYLPEKQSPQSSEIEAEAEVEAEEQPPPQPPVDGPQMMEVTSRFQRAFITASARFGKTATRPDGARSLRDQLTQMRKLELGLLRDYLETTRSLTRESWEAFNSNKRGRKEFKIDWPDGKNKRSGIYEDLDALLNDVEGLTDAQRKMMYDNDMYAMFAVQQRPEIIWTEKVLQEMITSRAFGILAVAKEKDRLPISTPSIRADVEDQFKKQKLAALSDEEKENYQLYVNAILSNGAKQFLPENENLTLSVERWCALLNTYLKAQRSQKENNVDDLVVSDKQLEALKIAYYMLALTEDEIDSVCDRVEADAKKKKEGYEESIEDESARRSLQFKRMREEEEEKEEEQPAPQPVASTVLKTLAEESRSESLKKRRRAPTVMVETETEEEEEEEAMREEELQKQEAERSQSVREAPVPERAHVASLPNVAEEVQAPRAVVGTKVTVPTEQKPARARIYGMRTNLIDNSGVIMELRSLYLNLPYAKLDEENNISPASLSDLQRVDILKEKRERVLNFVNGQILGARNMWIKFSDNERYAIAFQFLTADELRQANYIVPIGFYKLDDQGNVLNTHSNPLNVDRTVFGVLTTNVQVNNAGVVVLNISRRVSFFSIENVITAQEREASSREEATALSSNGGGSDSDSSRFITHLIDNRRSQLQKLIVYLDNVNLLTVYSQDQVTQKIAIYDASSVPATQVFSRVLIKISAELNQSPFGAQHRKVLSIARNGNLMAYVVHDAVEKKLYLYLSDIDSFSSYSEAFPIGTDVFKEKYMDRAQLHMDNRFVYVFNSENRFYALELPLPAAAKITQELPRTTKRMRTEGLLKLSASFQSLPSGVNWRSEENVNTLRIVNDAVRKLMERNARDKQKGGQRFIFSIKIRELLDSNAKQNVTILNLIKSSWLLLKDPHAVNTLIEKEYIYLFALLAYTWKESFENEYQAISYRKMEKMDEMQNQGIPIPPEMLIDAQQNTPSENDYLQAISMKEVVRWLDLLCTHSKDREQISVLLYAVAPVIGARMDAENKAKVLAQWAPDVNKTAALLASSVLVIKNPETQDDENQLPVRQTTLTDALSLCDAHYTGKVYFNICQHVQSKIYFARETREEDEEEAEEDNGDDE